MPSGRSRNPMLRSRRLAQSHPRPVRPFRVLATGAARAAGGGGADRGGDLEAARVAGRCRRAVRGDRAGTDPARPLFTVRLRADLSARQEPVPPARRVRHRRHEPAAAADRSGDGPASAAQPRSRRPDRVGDGHGAALWPRLRPRLLHAGRLPGRSNSRILFSLFLATAMSISAMPVIAKILIDLDLTKRNIGLVILSAGVVDDTVGWLILSLIAGAATHGVVRVQDLGLTVLALAVFIVVAIFILYPLLRIAVRIATEHFKASDSDLVLVIVTTFLCAAATERIGVHPVFGAFVTGIVLHQA